MSPGWRATCPRCGKKLEDCDCGWHDRYGDEDWASDHVTHAYGCLLPILIALAIIVLLLASIIMWN